MRSTTFVNGAGGRESLSFVEAGCVGNTSFPRMRRPDHRTIQTFQTFQTFQTNPGEAGKLSVISHHSPMSKMRSIIDINQLDQSKTYTYADYLTWQLKDRIELIMGRIFRMSPAPSSEHQQIVSALHGNIYP